MAGNQSNSGQASDSEARWAELVEKRDALTGKKRSLREEKDLERVFEELRQLRAGEKKAEKETASASAEAGEAEKEAREARRSGVRIPSFNKSPKSAPEPSGMGAYYFLLILGIFSYALKGFVPYAPELTFLVSIITGLFFILIVRGLPNSHTKEGLVMAAFAFDVMGAQTVLGFLPQFPYTDTIIGIHVFVWLIVGVILFLMGFVETMESGKKVGKISWLLFFSLFILIFMLAFPSYAEAPYLYQQASHSEYYIIAKEQSVAVGEKIKERGISLFDQVSCAFSFTAETLNTEGCIKDKQIERACQKNFDSESEQQLCIKQQKEGNIKVSGITDQTNSLPMKADFVKSEFFPDVLYRYDNEKTPTTFPIKFQVENPREQPFSVEISCKFVTLAKEEIPGTIMGLSTLEVKTKKAEATFVCEPATKLNSTYTLVYEANFPSLISMARLQRAFIGEKSLNWKEEWIPKIKNIHFSSGMYLSQSPPDFVQLNFAFGNPIENPIIENTQNLILSSTIENIGSGDVTAIKQYRLFLPGFGFNPNNNACREGTLLVPKLDKRIRQRIFYAPSCPIESLPAELQPEYDYVFKEFTGVVEYSYVIRKEIPIVVQIVKVEG